MERGVSLPIGGLVEIRYPSTCETDVKERRFSEEKYQQEKGGLARIGLREGKWRGNKRGASPIRIHPGSAEEGGDNGGEGDLLSNGWKGKRQ